MVVPPFRGGQGRTDREVRECSAMVVVYAMLAIGAIVLIVLLNWLWPVARVATGQ